MKKIKLSDIRIDGGTQIRVVLDQNRVYQYRDCMVEGDVFPPIRAMFDGTDYWLYGGFHRYHAMRLLNLKEIDVEVKNGTQKEAKYAALLENYDHGLPLTVEDKKKKVYLAIELEGESASNYLIAKIARVSQSFVASLRDPKAKEKQKETKEKHVVKKAEEIQNTSQTSTGKPVGEPDPYAGQAPDDDEIRASEIAQQLYMDEIQKVMESDDKLAEANEAIKKLTHMVAQMEIRFEGVMSEKNEAIKMVKKLQKENDKLKGKK